MWLPINSSGIFRLNLMRKCFFFFLSNLSCHLSLENRFGIQSKDFLTNTLLITNIMSETLHRTEISTPPFVFFNM